MCAPIQGSVLLTVTPPTGEPQRYLVAGTDQVMPLTGPGLVKELHEGTWAGAWSGALNFLAAIALMALTGTGLYSWLRRARQARRRSGDANASTLVAYASQTGTAARLAEATAQALREAGEAVVCASLAALDPRELIHFQHNLLIVSTTGEGDVPDPARPFLNRLGAADLKATHFNLLALGDSRYANFCGGGQKVRAALLEQGANEAAEWRRADGEPTAAWRDWLNGVAGLLGVPLGAVQAPETDRPMTLTLAERARQDNAGPVWLLFGNRHRQGDFFYRRQFEGWQQQGALTRLDTAFSRDADDGRYIQDRLTEHGAELLRWLAEERGALYTCGRARRVRRSNRPYVS